jgi:hypothetical protein
MMFFTSDDNYSFPTDNSSKYFNETDFDFPADESAYLQCPVYSNEDNILTDHVTFWVDGVAQCILSFTGIIANIISALILGK